VQEKYEAFKESVQRKWRVELEKDAKRNAQNHPALIQVIYLLFDAPNDCNSIKSSFDGTLGVFGDNNFLVKRSI